MTSRQAESSLDATQMWQFWIDVGGTFTDCMAQRPDGTLLRHKLLSSAITKGAVSVGAVAKAFCDPARRQDPPHFWRGYQVSLLDERGQPICSSCVAEFERSTGTLALDPPLAIRPLVGQTYELHSHEDAPLLAIRYLMQLPLDQPVPPVSVRLGTTRGTNALLTRRGARTALITTTGLGDVLEIGYQNRPKLFDLSIEKPAPIIVTTLEIDERIDVEGRVLVEPQEAKIRTGLQQLRSAGIESLAICLLHAYRNPHHEQLVARLAREVGFEEISCSHQVAPLIKIVARGDTTCVDAYLNPILRSYVRSLRSGLGVGSDLRMLTSSGGLVEAERFLGKDSILSGPAGGVVGFSKVASAAGFSRAIGFDMGGTSTDVTRFDGQFELQYETLKAGVRVVAPMMAIETVAAGGGSLCQFDGVKLTVGPDSAGADPGPACYGRGGPLTVTDMNLFTGRLLAQAFPFPLDAMAVERALIQVCDRVSSAVGRRWEPMALARGFLQVANANMAKAIRAVSVTRGYDPRDYVLVSFGGAAPQHACAIADDLGMQAVLNHPDGGILSAYGIGLADVVRHRVAGVYRPLQSSLNPDVQSELAQLTAEVIEEVRSEGVPDAQISVTQSLDLRYAGVDAYLTITHPDDGDYRAAFEHQHRQRYGYVHSQRLLEIVAARVQAIGRSNLTPIVSRKVASREARSDRNVEVYFDDQPQLTRVFSRSDLQPGDTMEGPVVVVDQTSTTVVDPGWSAEVLSGGELLIKRRSEKAVTEQPTGSSATASQPDPIELELYNNQFAGIAEKMGITLRNTSTSVNVKERLDFSCALFTSEGNLVVNAPHIPVHLGAMSETVKCLLEDNRSLAPGDVFVTNDPFRGGSHLPDITVITPVHDTTTSDQPRLLFFTASRAHHAEIGGIVPGSMPPFSECLAEEGVLIRSFKLLDRGVSHHAALRDLLSASRYPSRSVGENMADIEAAVAANQQGAGELLQLIQRKGLTVVQAYMEHIQAAAARKMRAALAQLPDGRHEFIDHLDNGAPIKVVITVHGDGAIVDFTGTGPPLPGNLNANRAIVTAAVMYVFRCLINDDIPLNQGVLAPLQILLPTCLLNPPTCDDPMRCAAVAGGNVETSQRVVDVLLGALGMAAASQGTMNNLLFGDDTFGYYETICGGSGATPNAPGASAVQTHMTNTRLTDPEVLELRYPIRLRRFAIRRGSGGSGRHSGGDGVIREMEFLRPLQVSLLTQRRGEFAPYGLQGGQAGAIGRNYLVRSDGRVESLQALAQLEVDCGDVLTIETPGGGGYGAS